MPFQKGQSGNPAGRKKGTSNKTTQEWRSMIESILYNNFSTKKIADDLFQLSPKHRLEIFFKLLDFVLIKPNSNIIENEESNVHSNLMGKIYEEMNRKIEGNVSK